jgi:hypothetical protein
MEPSKKPRQTVVEFFGLIAFVCLGFGILSALFGGAMHLFSMDRATSYVVRGLISVWLGLAVLLITFILARLKKR